MELTLMKNRLLFKNSLLKRNTNVCSLKNIYMDLNRKYNAALRESILSNNVDYIEKKQKCKSTWTVIKQNRLQTQNSAPDDIVPNFFKNIVLIQLKV